MNFLLYELAASRRRIISSPCPGIAANNSPEAKHPAKDYAALFDALAGIFATSRIIPAKSLRVKSF